MIAGALRDVSESLLNRVKADEVTGKVEFSLRQFGSGKVYHTFPRLQFACQRDAKEPCSLIIRELRISCQLGCSNFWEVEAENPCELQGMLRFCNALTDNGNKYHLKSNS